MKKKIMFAAIVAMAMVAVGKGTGAPAEDEVFVKFLEGYYLAPDAAEAIAKIPYFEKSVKKSRRPPRHDEGWQAANRKGHAAMTRKTYCGNQV